MALAKTYVIIKVAAMGDNIMAFPVVNQIKKANSSNKVIWICGHKSTSLAQLQIGIDSVFSINEDNLLSGSFIQKFFEIIKIWIILFSIRNKEVFIFHSDSRYRILYPFLKGHHLFKPKQGTHHSYQYQNLIGLPELSPSEFYSLKTELLPKSTEYYDVILVPGGAKNTLRTDILRRYPIENYVELYCELISKGLKVTLIGGPEDSWVHEHFPKNVDSKIGKIKIYETLSLLKNCKTLISHDTGPMHFGAMMGTKVISLFGPTKKSDKEPLTNPESISLFEPGELTCVPCYDDKNYSPTCTDPVCLKNIRVEMIINYLKFGF